VEPKELGAVKEGQEDLSQERALKVYWTDDRLDQIARLRLESDPGSSWWEVSVCHGILSDGALVTVELPFAQLPKGLIRTAILKHARADRVFAEGLGVFDCIPAAFLRPA
jgi:hypothetical protein